MLSLEKIKNKIVFVLNKIHLLIFKTEAGPGTLRFAKNISYTSLGIIGYTFILFLVNFYVVRVFGPEEYGKYVLLYSAFNILVIPMFFGLNNSIVKYLPENSTDFVKSKNIISSGITGIAFFTIISLFIFYFFKESVANQLSLSNSLYLITLCFCFFAVIKGALDSIFKGFCQFKKQAYLSCMYALVILVSFFLINYFYSSRSYIVYVLSIMIGVVVYNIYLFFQFKEYLLPISFDKKIFSKLFRYGFLNTIAMLVWIFMLNFDRFVVNHYLDLKTVGIYAVYAGASTMLTSKLLGVFLNVFFPTAAGMEDKSFVNKKISKLFWFMFVPGLVVNFMIMLIMLFFYGNKYPINILWILIFSFSSLLYSFANIKWNLIATEGVGSMWYCTKHSVISLLFYIFFNIVLVKNFGITGSVLSMVIVSLYLLLSSEYYFKYVFKNIKKAN